MRPSSAKRPVVHRLLARSTSTFVWWKATPGWNSGLPDGQTLRSQISLIAVRCDSDPFLYKKSMCQAQHGRVTAAAAAGPLSVRPCCTGLQEFGGTASVGIASKTSPVLCSRPRVTFMRVPLRSHPCRDRGLKNRGRRGLIFPASSWVVKTDSQTYSVLAIVQAKRHSTCSHHAPPPTPAHPRQARPPTLAQALSRRRAHGVHRRLCTPSRLVKPALLGLRLTVTH